MRAAAASQLSPQTHPTPTSLRIAEIGVGTTGFGIFFILFGMLLYFDSVLLAFGNLLFLTGLSLIIGLRRTFSFFFQRHKLKGTSFFLGGVVIVLLRWPLLGMFLETYGFFSLFRGFFPVAFGFLGSASNIPFLSADRHLLTRMNVLLSRQLMLFLCATAFRETLENVAPMENPRTTGSQLGPATLRAPWEQSPRCAAGKPTAAGPRPRGAALCPSESSAGPRQPGPCAPRSRLIPAPRGAALVQREKDVSAYNWNSFGLRYGRRQAALPGGRGGARG
ncbi:hypothetical protein MJG53_010888 [Ovis ammon polii x Ovis aries]|uniref:Uncharacterized protein n=1 Tax=Ovis ammon polii x Ovis aries TaxID=2918886 RepID=A0ACB9UR64_9CETA|nr:hypothetical protein MJG53_010888 [Ovis ammon polii x Ovis aries]